MGAEEMWTGRSSTLIATTLATEKIEESALSNEQRILEIMGEIRQVLAETRAGL